MTTKTRVARDAARIAPAAALRPQQNACRECLSLDGFWDFQAACDGHSQGLHQGLTEPRQIGVPGSWNEQHMDLYNHFSEGWYQKRFFPNSSWRGRRIFVYFGSVCQNAEVWLNSVRLGAHTGPHLPFEFEVTGGLRFAEENLLVVLADGSLDTEALPPASQSEEDTRAGWGSAFPDVAYDFFPFSGIHRPVVLYSVASGPCIRDLRVATAQHPATQCPKRAEVSVQVELSAPAMGFLRFEVEAPAQVLREEPEPVPQTPPKRPRRVTAKSPARLEAAPAGSPTRSSTGSSSPPGPPAAWASAGVASRTKRVHTCVEVAAASLVDASLWLDRPLVWDVGQGHLYLLTVTLLASDRSVVDSYRIRFGVRDVQVSGNSFLLNGRPVHFRGFGKHEDFDVIGKGLCHPLIVKDYDLMQWVGANSFRTSHYPYAEEWLDLADERGVLVISENPFVGLGPRLYKQSVLQRALPVVEAHVRRDRNHPCVVMWSLANEPNGPGPAEGDDEEERPPSVEEKEVCMHFFRALVDMTRSLDPVRPLTYAMHLDPDSNPMADLFDVLCVNKYYGWYEWTGRIEDSLGDFVLDVESFHEAFGKPIILAEFGADAIAGVHHLPEVMFSEEFQSRIVELQYTKLLDKPWFLGAHVWNFADFRVNQSITRIVHNRKGVFTRSREPKLVAHTLRRLWRPAALSDGAACSVQRMSVNKPFQDSSGRRHPGVVRWMAPAKEEEAGAVPTASGQWKKRKSALWRTSSGLNKIQQLAETDSQAG